MRSPRSPAAAADPSAVVPRDAESLFRTKPISEIRASEAATRRDIDAKQQELRHLVGRSYRDLIDSADSILLMKSSCESISSNLTSISSALLSLSPSPSTPSPSSSPNPARARVYATAARVKYLVDTPENIWGCLDESMLLEAACRYLRARLVHALLTAPAADLDVLAKFPLLRHQWQIVSSFKGQISQRSRERLAERGLTAAAYADALAAAATIDDLDPKQVLALFLDSRRAWISQKMAGAAADPDSSTSVLCDVVRTVRSSMGQVGEFFVLALNEMPLFYQAVLESPPGTQLFGGIPNPEEEVRLWKMHREKLESVMVLLEPEYISDACSSWLKCCCDEIFGELPMGKHLIDAITSGEELGSVEKLVREVLDDREKLEESLEQWLKSVFGSETESPWNQLRGLILKHEKDILEDKLEEAFVTRMKEIVHSGFEELSKDINVRACIEEITGGLEDKNDFQTYLKKPSTGGVWFSEPAHRKTGLGYSLKLAADETNFQTCLNGYLGLQVSQIRDSIDNKCGNILEDLLFFVESHNSTLRLKELTPHLQDKCYKTISAMLKELENVLRELSASLGNTVEKEGSQPSSVIVERSLFIGRLLFAIRNHSSHIPLILGSPRQWLKEKSGAAFGNQSSVLLRHSKSLDSPVSFSPRIRNYNSPRTNTLNSPRTNTLNSPRSPRKQYLDTPRRQIISALAALFPVGDKTNPKLEDLNKTLQELCFRAHSLWITWVSNELSVILDRDLNKDSALSASTPLRGWEVTVIKQEQSSEGPLEMKIALPSLPSLYITSFLYQACLEIHKVGGHVLDKSVVQYFAWKLIEKVVGIYENFLSNLEASEFGVSEKGILQILLDLRFTADILSGGKDSTLNRSELNAQGEPSKNTIQKSPFRRKQAQFLSSSTSTEPIVGIIRTLSRKLDPVDWETYESYLWENEKQSYKQYAVLFGFLVQLNRVYIDTELKYKPNMDSNILRCTTVPRFKYLPIRFDKRITTFAEEKFQRDGIDVKTGFKVVKVSGEGITMTNPSTGQITVPYGMAVWSTGIGTRPVILDFMKQIDQGSRRVLATDEWLRVRGCDGVYALGDCATISQRRVMDDISEIFKAADKDNSGTITVKEIKEVLGDICIRYPQVELYMKSNKMKNFLDLLKESSENPIKESVRLDIEEFKKALARVDSQVKNLPATAQVAAQQGYYLAQCFNKMKYAEENPEGPFRIREAGRHRFRPFRYKHLGQFAPLGGEQTAAQLPGDWVSIGHGSQWLWYSVYASKQVSWRTRFLVVSDWMRRFVFGRDSSCI